MGESSGRSACDRLARPHPIGAFMKVAAYQASLLTTLSRERALQDIRASIDWCERNDVEVLCFPEGVLGGLADYVEEPFEIAFDVRSEEFRSVVTRLASPSVMTIFGFTENDGGRLFNSAAAIHDGAVVGIYRKLHPAIRRSVYQPGSTAPIFSWGRMRFGILICRDSNFESPARDMAARGAKVLFIPTNNGLPPGKPLAKIAAEARRVDEDLARKNKVWVVRADVSGDSDRLQAHGSSEIVTPEGVPLRSAEAGFTGPIVAELDI